MGLEASRQRLCAKPGARLWGFNGHGKGLATWDGGGDVSRKPLRGHLQHRNDRCVRGRGRRTSLASPALILPIMLWGGHSTAQLSRRGNDD